MSKDIPKSYELNDTELNIYKIWEDAGLFNPEKLEQHLKKKGLESKDTFTITLPLLMLMVIYT